MRITFAMGPYFPVPAVLGSGVEKVQLALAEEMAKAGHSITMISRTFSDFPREEMRSGVSHIRVPSWDTPRSRILSKVYDLFYARRVAKMLPYSDVTITNSLFLPIVLPREKAGHIYIHVARYPKGQMWLYWRADRIQAVSTAVAHAIATQTPILRDRICVIPPPLVNLFAEPASTHKLQNRSQTILYVGRIAKEKGIHLLIEAFTGLVGGSLSGFKLNIVGPHEVRQGGDGLSYLNQLKKLAVPAGRAIEFSGFVNDAETLRAIYEAADIFVYPSLAEKGESFGAAPLEAMAAGCRTIVSDLGCFREYLEPGINGIVFNHRRNATSSLTEAIIALIGDNDALKMRRAAVATAGRFLIKPITRRYLEDFALLTGLPN